MMQKMDFEKLRMKTIMSEALNQMQTSSYQTIRDNAAIKLKFLQEEFKGTFGEYSKEHEVLIEKEQIKYAEITIDNLIKKLEKLKTDGSTGYTKIQVNGTLMCKDAGNVILLNNIKQM